MLCRLPLQREAQPVHTLPYSSRLTNLNPTEKLRRDYKWLRAAKRVLQELEIGWTKLSEDFSQKNIDACFGKQTWPSSKLSFIILKWDAAIGEHKEIKKFGKSLIYRNIITV